MENKEIFKLLSLLLRYPEESIQELIKEIDISEIENQQINEFLEFYKNTPIIKLQEEYVKNFDFNDSATLYLTFHRFKDDTKRGTYLAKLIDYYREKGFNFVGNELPDFLPVVLDFISEMDEEIGIKILESFEKEIEKIYETLKETETAYTKLFELILDLTKKREVK